MLDKIVNILQQQCKIDANNLLLLGLSGGPDSLCLLHVLVQAGYPIFALHVNHGLRTEADSEVKPVEDVASSLGVEFASIKLDVSAYSRQHPVSIEEAARILRYQVLFEQAQAHKASAVVVGHTADDQVETILLHLLRGTGIVGLRGMQIRKLPNPWSTEIPLLRPLLSTRRAEIQRYIDVHGLVPISDKSNQDISFLRNRIRHELLPLLDRYNPSFRESVLRMGESMKDDFSVLQDLVSKAWDSLLLQQGSGFLKFNTAGFLELPPSIQRYLLRKAIEYHLPGLRDVGFDCIDRGMNLLVGVTPGKQTDLIAGIRLVKEGEEFWLVSNRVALPQTGFPAITPGEQVMLLIPSKQELGSGWQLDVEEVYDPEAIHRDSGSNSDPFQAWMDISEVKMPLVARTRHPGDRIHSMGLNGHSTKISDLMINLKLPERARLTWPLICSGDEVLWVPGYRLSQLVQVRSDSVKALHLKLTRSQVS
jgi:tRNA(Ile)-lysidine synthase